jgi:hypothetical protein
MYRLGYGCMLPLSKPPNSITLPKSGNTYLEDDDEHQGETKQKANLEHHDPLSDSTNGHYFHEKKIRH